MRRLLIISTIFICSFLTPAIFVQDLSRDCQILYLDMSDARLVMYSPVTENKTVIDTGFVPYTGNAVTPSYALSPDQHLIAISLPDTGISQPDMGPDRYGTKIFDISGPSPALLDTILFWWPDFRGWSHGNTKLLLSLIHAAEGTHQIYNVNTRTATRMPQIISGNTYSGRLQLNVFGPGPTWSLDDRYVAFEANEWPFPQDEYGTNNAVFATPVDGTPIRLTERSANVSLIGWLPDGRVLFAVYTSASSRLVAATPDGKQQEVLYESASDSLAATLSPSGDKVALGWLDGPSSKEKDTYILAILDLRNKQVSQFAHVTTDSLAGNWSAMNWSPDGKHLTYRTFIHQQSRLYIVNAGDLIPTLIDFQDAGYDDLGSWSPDSTQLLLESGPDDDPHLLIYDVQTKELTTVSLPAKSSFDPVVPGALICPHPSQP